MRALAGFYAAYPGSSHLPGPALDLPRDGKKSIFRGRSLDQEVRWRKGTRGRCWTCLPRTPHISSICLSPDKQFRESSDSPSCLLSLLYLGYCNFESYYPEHLLWRLNFSLERLQDLRIWAPRRTGRCWIARPYRCVAWKGDASHDRSCQVWVGKPINNYQLLKNSMQEHFDSFGAKQQALQQSLQNVLSQALYLALTSCGQASFYSAPSSSSVPSSSSTYRPRTFAFRESGLRIEPDGP